MEVENFTARFQEDIQFNHAYNERKEEKAVEQKEDAITSTKELIINHN